MNERRLRSAIKAFSWRTVGTLDTIVISWIITGKLSFAFSIGTVELFTKMLLYYLHERAWDKVKIGKIASSSERIIPKSKKLCQTAFLHRHTKKYLEDLQNEPS